MNNQLNEWNYELLTGDRPEDRDAIRALLGENVREVER